MRRCQVVARVSSEFAPGWSSGSGERDVDLADADGDDLVAYLHVVPGQRDDVFDLLAEDEDEDGCSTIPACDLFRVDDALDRMVLIQGAHPGDWCRGGDAGPSARGGRVAP